MSTSELRRVFELNHMAQQMAAMRIQPRYGPDLPERELRLRLAALWLDRGGPRESAAQAVRGAIRR